MFIQFMGFNNFRFKNELITCNQQAIIKISEADASVRDSRVTELMDRELSESHCNRNNDNLIKPEE